MENAELIYEDEIDGIKIYRNKEGFLEGYKGTGKIVSTGGGGVTNLQNMQRIVSIATNVDDFMKFVRGKRTINDKATTQQLKNQQAKLFM